MKNTLLILFFLALITTNAQIPSHIPQNGLTGWWPFNGNADDESGNNDNGEVVNAKLVEDRFGNCNAAYYFDKDNDYIKLNTQNVTEYSVSAWLSYFNIGDSSSFFNKGSFFGTADESFSTYNAGRYIARIANSSGWNELQILSFSNPDIVDSVYHHVVVTYDQSYVKMYLNGQIQDSLAVSGPINSSSTNKYIGAVRNYDNSAFIKDHFFYGVIDEVAMWNRAISPQEVLGIYNAPNIHPNQSVEVSISPSEIQAYSGDIITVTASHNTTSPTLNWQARVNGLPWTTILPNPSYSFSSDELNLLDIRKTFNGQEFRVIATTGNCADTSEIATLQIMDTCLTTIFDTVTTYISVTDTLIIDTETSVGSQNDRNVLKVYPNPAKTKITIHTGDFVSISNYTISIENEIGQEVFKETVNQQIFSIDINDIGSKGMYFLRLYNENMILKENRKIIIE